MEVPTTSIKIGLTSNHILTKISKHLPKVDTMVVKTPNRTSQNPRTRVVTRNEVTQISSSNTKIVNKTMRVTNNNTKTTVVLAEEVIEVDAVVVATTKAASKGLHSRTTMFLTIVRSRNSRKLPLQHRCRCQCPRPFQCKCPRPSQFLCHNQLHKYLPDHQPSTWMRLPIPLTKNRGRIWLEMQSSNLLPPK